MNPSHYPDLERCKKLTELGFPVTQMSWQKNGFWEYRLVYLQSNYWDYVCPSVMEMMDVIPKIISELHLQIKCYESWYSVRYQKILGYERSFDGTYPNALADLIIWLVENGHLTFDKR